MVLTPTEIVQELDKFIIGQHKAKKMVAIAIRNRWRAGQLPKEIQDEFSPKNIMMIGPTGVGKTEIARRLAKLCGSPFIKVEATKFTEVGYVGRDVESIIRDLLDIAMQTVKSEEKLQMRVQAEQGAEERLLNALLPASSEAEQSSLATTREKIKELWKSGALDTREIEIDVEEKQKSFSEVPNIPGMEHVGKQMQDAFSKIFPTQKKKRIVTVAVAWEILLSEESERLLDEEKIIAYAKERVEKTGIVFIDEIDKVSSQNTSSRGDISREGVQRDLLPIVEGSSVTTKYGVVQTDGILFIVAGAFHTTKPSNLIPELQGRFPIRVELDALTKEDFYRILVEPNNALLRQYEALLSTEGVSITFTDDAIEEIASFAELVNTKTENIGARRLYTIVEKILTDISFTASDMYGTEVIIDTPYVQDKLQDVRDDEDLRKYVL